MAEIQCFLLLPTDVREASLRRYRSSGSDEKCCGPYGYHNAHFYLPNEQGIEKPFESLGSGDNPDKNDARWPKKCEYCDYLFTESDCWQIFRRHLFQRSDNGELVSIIAAPPGAMWWAEWLAGIHAGGLHETKRGNGPHLCVKTPGGDWDIDAPASNGADGWDRTGEPPIVTATPSIICQQYHGWLRDGKLIEV